MMQCASCNQENPEGAAFCGNCGTRLPASVAVVSSPSPSPAAGRPETGPVNTSPANIPNAQSQGFAPPTTNNYNLPPIYLVCVAGPDAGKRAAITAMAVVIGRGAECGLLSGDPLVSAKHVSLFERDGALRYYALEGSSLFVDGVERREGILSPGQQLRIGGSYWQVAMAAASAESPSAQGHVPRAVSPPAGGLFGRMADHVSAVTGVEKVEGFNAKEIFSSVLEKRTDEDVEEYFLVGTPTTTPSLQQIKAIWPKPWVFFKTFTLALGVYMIFYF